MSNNDKMEQYHAAYAAMQAARDIFPLDAWELRVHAG